MAHSTHLREFDGSGHRPMMIHTRCSPSGAARNAINRAYALSMNWRHYRYIPWSVSRRLVSVCRRTTSAYSLIEEGRRDATQRIEGAEYLLLRCVALKQRAHQSHRCLASYCNRRCTRHESVVPSSHQVPFIVTHLGIQESKCGWQPRSSTQPTRYKVPTRHRDTK